MNVEEVGPQNPDQPKKQVNKGEQLFKVSVSGKFEDLIRNALSILDNNDPDGAVVRNGSGFNKKDGEPARELINKDDWNNEDLNEAYNIAKHYMNTQLKDKWKDIALEYDKWTKEIKNEEKNKILEEIEGGNWTPIEFENDVPITYAGWSDGQPYKLRIRESKDKVTTIMQKITLRNYENQNIQAKIKRLKIQGNDMIEFGGEVFGKNDFVNLMVFPANCNLFTECINALPIDEEEYREPKFYMEDGFIKFPSKFYARRDDSYQKMLKDALKIGNVDSKIYQEAISLMRKRSKQLTLHYAIIGSNVINIIGFEDYLITVDVIGDSDSGKSFVIDSTLKLCYGIDIDGKIQNDSAGSAYRHHNIAGSTNLPIYIEEALMDHKSLAMLKSNGKNVRGRPDQTLKIYSVIATFIFSRNTESDDMKNIDPIERKAQNKRIHKFIFLREDIITDSSEKMVGAEFLGKIKGSPGGLLYEKLKSKPIIEIVKKYKEIKSKETKIEKIIALLGSWIMDDPDFVPVVTEVKQPTILDEFFGTILDYWDRNETQNWEFKDGNRRYIGNYSDNIMRTNLKLSENIREFAISVTGFNTIKKSFGYTGSAENFAISYGFQYKNIRFGDTVQKAIAGIIPEDVVKEEPNKDTENTVKTEEKIQKVKTEEES